MVILDRANTIIKSSCEQIIEELGVRIEKMSNLAIEKNENFKVGLTGGSMLSLLTKAFVGVKTNWSKWYIFFCDERFSVETEPLHKIYENHFNNLKIPIPAENIIKVNTDLIPSESAKDYISKLCLHFPTTEYPKFNCLFLGVGPDGHVCSLFPDNEKVLTETSLWVVPVESAPKPPPRRITFTLPLINSAENCIFVVRGIEKREVIQKIIDGANLPVSKISLIQGNIQWILDENSAPLLWLKN